MYIKYMLIMVKNSLSILKCTRFNLKYCYLEQCFGGFSIHINKNGQTVCGCGKDDDCGKCL